MRRLVEALWGLFYAKTPLANTEAARSSCEAEIIALSEAAKDFVYLLKLTKGLGEPEPGVTSLYTDSQR